MLHTMGARQLCLYGDLVNEDGSISRRQFVLLAGGRIQSVGSTKPPGVRRPDYTLKDDELMFPAFLDLHTHSSYNMLPLWHSPYWAWDNRFQWRANAQYKQSIGGLERAIVYSSGEGTGTYAAFNAFSELMALAGGTTVLQENAHLDGAGFPRQVHVLIRSTGSPSDMGLAANEQVASVTDFYEPDPYTAPRNPPQDTGSWQVKVVAKGPFDGASYVNDFTLSVTGARTRGTIVHLGEGRSGFLQTTLGPDPYSRNEFETFKRFITESYRDGDVRKIRDARLLLIHGCGMNTVGTGGGLRRGSRDGASSTVADTIAFLRTYGIGVIWSPVSNLLLYQDTTNVLPLLDAGIPVALGTDWTPSGSKTVWEEAKFAADFLEARRWKGDIDLTCFKAVTSVPADLLGLPLGRIRQGNFADLLVMRRPPAARRGSALLAFRRGGDEDVRVVIGGGVPLYGDPDLIKALGGEPLPLPDERPAISERSRALLATRKAFTLPAGSNITLDGLTKALSAADHVIGRNRPRILAADDPDYLSRMQELRTWVRDFGTKVSPSPKPAPAPPSGLAPGEQEWMYNPSLDPKQRIPDDVASLLGRIAPCRDEDCEVPKRHPYYHAEVLTEAGDSYGFRVPCMPVVPILTNLKQLFVMGDFPTAKFTARSTNCLPVIGDNPETISADNEALRAFLHSAGAQVHGDPHLLQTYVEEIDDLVRNAFARPDITDTGSHGRSSREAYTPPRKNEFFVPIGDVFAPMQDASYFDGYKVRNVAAGVFFQKYYLTPVGVDIDSQVWLTNMIKCFLFHPNNASSYRELGWTDVSVEASYSELLPVGKVCSQWINEEVQVCGPKLVLTVGKPPCVLLHDVPFDDTALQGRVYNELLGVRLRANDTRLETAIATKLKLESKYPPPFPRGPEKRTLFHRATAAAAPETPRPVSITRLAPWSGYDVFHMMHPQAVMMSQTGVSQALSAALKMVLGQKANGMTFEQLDDALAKYLRSHSTSDLIKALPYGQRDAYYTNARLLERHAVTMANFADALTEVGLPLNPRVDGDTVLAAQAAQLAGTFHLADSADAELKRLQEQRAAQRARIAGYLRSAGR